MKRLLCLLISVLLLTAICFAATDHASDSMERKLRRIEDNAAQAHPDSTPVDFTESEVNAYFASEKIDLPPGVESVRLQGEPGIVTANTRVNFDKLKGGTGSLNPLLSIFTGVHEVVVVAHAHGSRGIGYVHVDSVSLDGVEIPRFALELFAEKYLQPQYPDIGLDSRFGLPDRIQSAIIGEQKVTIVQR